MSWKLTISWIKSIINQGLARGMSGRAILRELREQGVRIRTADFYALYREQLRSFDFEQYAQFIDESKKIPDYRIPTTIERIPTRYKFIIEAETNQGIVHFGIYTDQRMSLAEIKQEALRMLVEEYGLSLEGALRVIRAVRRKV